MWIYASDRYVLPLPAGHRFPMRKYAALRERVRRLAPERLREPPAADDGALGRVHAPAYIDAVTNGRLDAAAQRRIGFPWTPAMVERSRRSAGATMAACRSALVHGVGVNLAGGTHHAHRDFGAGFCVFNDAAVAARAMQVEAGVDRVLIVDLDVHQGDGTADILGDEPAVFTFSMHGERNYPVRKIASDLDIALPDGTGDAAYLERLATILPELSARARWDIVFYNAGVDVHAEDRLGRLALSNDGLRARDEMVIGHFRALGIPVCGVIGGGYSTDVPALAARHAILFEVASGMA